MGTAVVGRRTTAAAARDRFLLCRRGEADPLLTYDLPGRCQTAPLHGRAFRFQRRPRPDLLLVVVIVNRQPWILEVASQCRPAIEAVVQRLGRSRADGRFGSLCDQPLVQRLGDGR